MTPAQVLHSELTGIRQSVQIRRDIGYKRQRQLQFKNFCRRINELYPRLDYQEMVALWRRKDLDPAARDKLLKHILFVACMAVWRYRRIFWRADPFDLLAEGLIGLYYSGIQNFDDTKSNSYVSYFYYAAWVAMSRFIRVWSNSIGARKRSRSTVGVRKSFCPNYLIQETKQSVDALSEVVDRYIHYNGCDYLGGDTRTPEELLIAKETEAAVDSRIQEIMAGSSFRSRSIIARRWLAATPATLQELGQELGVSRERIRQLEAKLKQQLSVVLADLA